MSYILEYAFAGIWPLLWHYGLAGFLIICALAWAWFMPVFKKTALWVALGVLIGTVCYGIGVNNGEYRVQSKWDAAERATAQRGDRIREKAESEFPEVAEPDEPAADPVPAPVDPAGNVRRKRVPAHKKLDKYDRD